MEDSFAGVVGVVQLAIAAVTLLYVVFGLGARFAVIEFQVGQLWRWYVRERRPPEEKDDADRERG